MTKAYKSIAAFASLALICGAVGVVTIAPTPVLAQDDEEKPKRSQTLDPAVAKVLQVVFEDMQAENFQVALGKLNDLIASRGDRMKAYDKSTTYELRGSVKAQLEDYRGAQRDFQTALDAGGLNEDRNNQLRYFIAQINFQLEDYRGAIQGLNAWISSARAAGKPVSADAYYLLAAAYAQIEPPNYSAAVRPAEQAVATRAEPKKSDHDLLNLAYSETNANTKRAALLEKMINLWPKESSYWTQLSGLYSTTGKDKDAFAVLEVAYRAGLVKKEAEILTLVQYYSFFDNPYRGAKLLEREMGANNVKTNVNNLKLLSQMWSQAREHKRAIPVLERAAGMAEDGELYYRLGQVLIADEQYAKGEQAMARARARGGLTARQIGDSWLLTGTARFSQAGQGDRAQRNRAREAFANAARYESSAAQGRQWVAYINAINSTEDAQDRLACTQAEEERQAAIDRTRQQLQVCRLQGGGAGACTSVEEDLQALETTEPPECVKIRGGGGSEDTTAAVSETPTEPGGAAPAVATESPSDDGQSTVGTDGGEATEEEAEEPPAQ